MRLKSRAELIPCYAVHVMFNLLSSFCIWAKTLTYINQIMSNNIIFFCKSHLQLCPLKTVTTEASWELYRFYFFTLFTVQLIYIYI